MRETAGPPGGGGDQPAHIGLAGALLMGQPADWVCRPDRRTAATRSSPWPLSWADDQQTSARPTDAAPWSAVTGQRGWRDLHDESGPAPPATTPRRNE